MRSRCNNPKNKGYCNYGGRGIIVCARWVSFETFFTDMGERPSPKHSIDRIDNDGNYEPSNCRWATKTQQARNRRSNTLITWQGQRLSRAEWAEKTGIGESTIKMRLRSGWPIELALTVAPDSVGNRGIGS